MEWIDIGANLTHDSFDADRGAVLERAWQAGVAHILVTGADLAHSAAAIALARTDPRLAATAGVHPHHASTLDASGLAQLGELIEAPEVVAIGECGLDYHRNFSPPADQRRALAAQLALAAGHRKPVFLHQRDAHADFFALLREHRPALRGGVVHCFTGTAAELEAYLALDLSIGITGWICDERRRGELPSIVARIPAGRLMVETDAPYLLPRDLRPRPASRRNEPMHLAHVGAAVALARAETPAVCAAHTSAHARSFFGLATPPASATRAGSASPPP